jgi:hypothetical protein
MNSLQINGEPIAHAYQATHSMPAVGIRASDWVLYRPTTFAAPGDLIFGKYDDTVSVGRLLRNDDGDLVFYDGATGKTCVLRKPHELRVFGVVIAVRGEGVFH